MIINFQEDPLSATTKECVDAAVNRKPWTCFVDGVEIKQVWYANTETGVVKTYDVLRDDRVYASSDAEAIAKALLQPSVELEILRDSALSETLRGRVEIKQ